jgi:hypothetical protein
MDWVRPERQLPGMRQELWVLRVRFAQAQQAQPTPLVQPAQ